MVPFDLGHLEKRLDELAAAGAFGELGGVEVLVHVATFDPTGAEHGKKPTRHMAEKADDLADDAHHPLAPRRWRRAE